ncbi:putative peptide-N(4)-(N-acetyl-beta-glucosaminyl)asparagine amidase [Helianthus annuus]|nr:putative peptide-N(4)-(N-acetyl-beta-glucosaminyl)asparagine amidase [Helianthus annuus]
MPLQITKAMKITYLFTLIHLFFVQCSPSPSPSPSPPHFVGKHSLNNTTPQQYFEVTHPLPTDDITPSCSVSLLNHSFANTYGSPPVTVNYTPPKSKCKWSVAVLEFQAECKGEQYDRIAGVWLDGVELLRTSTAQPTEAGIFWKVRKDVSRYSSVISQSNIKLTVMLENIVNKEFTGVYDVNISLHFYSASSVRVPLSIVSGIHTSSSNRKLVSVKNNEIAGKVNVDRVLKALYPYDKPADSVVPISGTNGVSEGFWFKIDDENDIQTTKVKIASKTYKAVLELYVSFHGNDEFWYMNPSDAYVETNHLSTGRAHGAYREVLVTIDGELVGAVVPFPVIFTGGINPLFWEPVVSIGAFNLPSYDIDLTPFLGRLLDNKDHKIGIQIADGISFWLVDANLHLWVDHSNVKAQTVSSKVPAMEIERKNEFVLLDGEFEIEGERESEVTSWVSSSAGNLTTKYKEKIKFKNKLKFKDQGTKKELDQTYKRKIKIKTTNEMGQVVENLEVKIKYPLDINTETRPGLDSGTTVMTTQVELERSERVSGGTDWMSLSHKLNCTGMMVVKGSSVLSGLAENHQNYNYKDGLGCYTRKVDVVNGVVVGDDPSSICS